MEYISDLLRFLWAVVTNWAGLATGGIIVAVLWLWSTVRQMPISRKFGIALALVFLSLAVFNVWREQYRMVREFQADVPDLRGHIDALLSGDTLNEGKPVPFVLAIVSIRNLKAPSIAQGYECQVKTADGRSLHGRTDALPTGMTFMDHPEWSGRFDNIAPLYDKTAETPIERGALRRGALMFTFPGATRLPHEHTTFSISFEDSLGKRVVCDFTAPSGGGDSPQYYPGMHK